jgi:hypothetical protein
MTHENGYAALTLGIGIGIRVGIEPDPDTDSDPEVIQTLRSFSKLMR